MVWYIDIDIGIGIGMVWYGMVRYGIDKVLV